MTNHKGLVEPIVDEEIVDDVEMADGDYDVASGALADIEPEVTTRVTFLDYLKSPMVELGVGSGAEANTLSEHEAILNKSSWFAERGAAFKRHIDLPNDDIDAVGSVLEYLENDPTVPVSDNEDVALLRYARAYITENFGLPTLKSLVPTKIHRTISTAKSEVAYAHYVYKETGSEDATIRKPVATS